MSTKYQHAGKLDDIQMNDHVRLYAVIIFCQILLGRCVDVLYSLSPKGVGPRVSSLFFVDVLFSNINGCDIIQKSHTMLLMK